MSLSTFYLEYSLARLHRRRRRAYAPTSNTASHDNYEKINSWVSFCFPYKYGAPLIIGKKENGGQNMQIFRSLGTGMKDCALQEKQSIGILIHDVVNDQGFAMHYRAISNTVSHLEVFRCKRINGLTSCLTLNVFEATIFQFGFLEGYNV